MLQNRQWRHLQYTKLEIQQLPFEFRRAALKECHDCYAAFLSSSETKRKLLLGFASLWYLSEQDIEIITSLEKPSIHVSSQTHKTNHLGQVAEHVQDVIRVFRPSISILSSSQFKRLSNFECYKSQTSLDALRLSQRLFLRICKTHTVQTASNALFFR